MHFNGEHECEQMNAEGWDVLATRLSHLHNSHQGGRRRWRGKYLFLHLSPKEHQPDEERCVLQTAYNVVSLAERPTNWAVYYVWR